MDTSPSTNLLMLGKGILKFDRFDSVGLPTGLRDLGNAPAFTIVPAIETLDHFSARRGVKRKDATVVLSVGGTAKFTLEEYDMENLALAMFGENAGGSVALLSKPQITGELRFYGRPDVGPWFDLVLHKVSLKNSSEIPMIGDDWGKFEFEFELLEDTGHPINPYGTITPVVES
jgi:hypothetical protein